MSYNIIDVNTSDSLKEKLIIYSHNCSFQGAGKFLAELLANNAFEKYEKVFVIETEDEIIGYGAILRECICIDNEIQEPWLDFLFVDEKYRNKHIGFDLIDKICSYAKNLGFSSIYLCTVTHTDYYAKAGFKILYSTNNYNSTINDPPIYVMEKNMK
ncbi:MAG: GNAT family N-acetyltransferase [Ruminiclostridium sp.]|nr:GNAT family N-acetyltransferase [Ruminiclostridium sp.]